MTNTLKSLFAGTQEQLAAKLKNARRGIAHPGDKGSVSEAEWCDLLTGFLPQRYCVSKATVIDSKGAVSESIDLVVYDRQYSPLVFEQAGFRYVAAEAVYAIFEVKQGLNSAHMEYAAKKAASVRRLHRTSAAVTDIRGGTPIKQPIPILAGLLTTEIEWSADGAADHVSILASGLDESHFLDFLCAADSFGFELVKQFNRLDLTASTHETGLVFFVFGLLQRLQQIGTVAPIDFSAYRDAI